MQAFTSLNACMHPWRCMEHGTAASGLGRKRAARARAQDGQTHRETRAVFLCVPGSCDGQFYMLCSRQALQASNVSVLGCTTAYGAQLGPLSAEEGTPPHGAWIRGSFCGFDVPSLDPEGTIGSQSVYQSTWRRRCSIHISRCWACGSHFQEGLATTASNRHETGCAAESTSIQ